MVRIFLKFLSLLVDLTQTVTIALSVWLVAYLFLGHGTQIYGSSMEPNFHDQQCVFTDIVSYRFSLPQRGDVVSIHAPKAANCAKGTGCDFFKRIIGLPGENIALSEGHFFINGEKLTEKYLPPTILTMPGPYTADRVVTLNENEYFVAGDNRSHSSDSRYWGPVQKSEIIGRAILRYCPKSDLGIIPRVVY